MPIEITITAYAYSELQGTAKERAREKLVEWRTDHEWWDCVYEASKEKGEELGFNIEDIRFSGFCSQGDGASWTGSVDLLEFIEKHADKESASFGEDMILCELIRNDWVNKELHIVRRSYHYCHENTITYEYNDWSDWERVSDDVVLHKGVMQNASVKQLCESFSVDYRINEWIETAVKKAKLFAQDIYRALREDYEDLLNDESLADFADLNKYFFDKNGRIL